MYTMPVLRVFEPSVSLSTIPLTNTVQHARSDHIFCCIFDFLYLRPYEKKIKNEDKEEKKRTPTDPCVVKGVINFYVIVY